MTDKPFSEMTVSEIKKNLSISHTNEATIKLLESDPRTGVQVLAKQIRQRQKNQEKEKARLEQLSELENKFRERGYVHIAGVDEAGRGPLAGPVIAAAVIFPPDTQIDGLNDSKKLSEQKRELLFDQIQNMALTIGVGEATPQEIDNLNIRNATHLAMRRALDHLSPSPDQVLVDGNALPESRFKELAIIGGDRKSISISAASIIAKVTRDRMMIQYDTKYPEYGFAGHKGYGSAEHLNALQKHGPTPIHRHSFAGVPQTPTTFTEDFEIFAEGIASAQNLDQLTAIGDTISLASKDLPPHEIERLREYYRTHRINLQRPGLEGEKLAADYLSQNGFTICELNFRTLGGEIDIIAQKGNVLSFVEVKTATQTQFGDPKTWVTPQKQKQLHRLAKAYLTQRNTPNLWPRFDVIAVTLSASAPQIEHIEGAFSKFP